MQMIVESHKQFLKCILQGKVKEAHPGRRRTSWLKIVRTWFKKTSTELFLLAVHKLMIARIVSICPTFVANGYFKKKKQEEGAFAYSLIAYSVNLQVPIGKPE